jgi:hypothetical protein
MGFVRLLNPFLLLSFPLVRLWRAKAGIQKGKLKEEIMMCSLMRIHNDNKSKIIKDSRLRGNDKL